MNALYKRPANIYLATRLQLVCKVIVCTIIFGAAFPILYPIAWLFCIMAEYVDRYSPCALAFTAGRACG